MRGIVLLAGILLLAIGTNAVFDEAFRLLQQRPGGLSIFNSVRCTVDGGRRFDVPLVPAEAGSNFLWRPQIPDYITLPDDLECANRNKELVVSVLPQLQGINMEFQRLSRPDNLGTVIPAAYQRLADNACGNPTYDDRSDIDNEFVIVGDTIINTTRESSVNDITFSTNTMADAEDERNIFEIIFRLLRCRVHYRYIDLGPAFLPRYMVSGGCTTRTCSIPINEGQTCRPDLSAIGRFPGLRYDCCWEYDDELEEYKYSCGWRRVMLPILCDCDCACPPRE